MKEKRWKVLIVDDEFRIGMLIKKLIRWDALSMECMDVVDNGETALQIIKEEAPDVVITDIRMPRINGLDMINMAKESHGNIKFVVVSGYKEFEYAHRALQYGVDDYILKPVNEEELNKVLRKIYNELVISEEQYKERQKMKETLSESRQIIKRDFLKNIIEQETEFEEKDARVSMEGEVYRGIDIKLDYVDYNRQDKKQDKLTLDRIVATVEGILKTVAEEVLICEKENLHIYCLFNYDYSKAKTIKNSINDILSEIKEQLIGFEQYEITIGVGTERTEFGEIRFSIKEAFRAVGNRIKLGTGRLIYAENIISADRNRMMDLIERYHENILTSIETYSEERLDNCINQIYSEFMLKDNEDFSQCYEIAEELSRIFFVNIDIDQDEMLQIRRRLWNNCQHCYSIIQLKKLLKNELGGYLSVVSQMAETEFAKPIRRAKKYMDEHYGERIVLEDIAKIVDLNPVYFSVLFKKETGMNFSSYLVNIRMEKAKEMICSTNDTIAAIGEKVGYKDARYFSQTFAKIVGIKPALYRKIHA